MNKSDRKHFRKLYDSKIQKLSISLNPIEKSLLDSMMQKEEWENAGGFIKYKLFGLNYEKKYHRAIASANEETLKKILINLMSDLDDQLDYINAKYTRELELLKVSTAMIDAKSISKWVALLKQWNDNVEKKTEQIFEDCKLLLSRMDIIVEKKKQDYLRSLPDSVLEEHIRNWNDTTSPEFQEYVRRQYEKK
jgi:hypothetical protein